MIGSGPIVIGQAAEFDYAGAQGCPQQNITASPYLHSSLSTLHSCNNHPLRKELSICL